MMKKILYILLCICCFQIPAWAQQRKPFVVVIDAGHGGHDAGAIGKRGMEKNINLNISLALGRMIEEHYPDVKVYYTRKTDVFVTLQGRADFVNQHKADLFICIHTNSTTSPAAYGTETYTLGLHKEESNLEVAKRENSVMLLEDDYKSRYQGFNPNSVDSYIMFEMMQDQYVDKSLRFATLVQNQFSSALHRYNRGVRQAGFWVLHKSACPSVLIEVGFISNPNEEAFLISKEGEQSMATAIYDAFRRYKADIDRRSSQAAVTYQPNATISTTPTKSQEPSSAKAQETGSKTPEVAPKTPEQKPAVKPENKPETKPETKLDAAGDKKADTSDDAKANVQQKIYKVQIFAVPASKSVAASEFKSEKATYYEANGMKKYTVGSFLTEAEAVAEQKRLATKFPGCFIVVFQNGHRIK